MAKIQDIQCIGFDADDTLWENGFFYGKALSDFQELFHSDDFETIENIFTQIEIKNMDTLGYGAKAMTISMIEAAIAIDPNISSNNILNIIEIGRSLFRVPIKMFPGAQETIEQLRKSYRVIIITKGEFNEQQRKFDLSPLDKSMDYFILDKKDRSSYDRLLKHENIDIDHFMMVGNSPKSDILPVLELGGWAAYIPCCETWSLEHAILPPHSKLLNLKSINELLNYV